MTQINRYDIGDLVRVVAVFTDIDGAEADPEVVKLSVLEPDGTLNHYTYLTDAEVVRDSEGNYHADLGIDQSRKWRYRWWSTGDGQAAGEKAFIVRTAYAVA